MHLNGKKILILVEEKYEDLELQYPRYRLLEEGAKITLAGEEEKHLYKGEHGVPCQTDISFVQVASSDYDALIIPGGCEASDKLRKNRQVLNIIGEFHTQKKLIAFICHAGWSVISAKIIKGVKCTSYLSIKDDMINAGAIWVDEPVVTDRHFISSRSPDDLPYFCTSIIHNLK